MSADKSKNDVPTGYIISKHLSQICPKAQFSVRLVYENRTDEVVHEMVQTFPIIGQATDNRTTISDGNGCTGQDHSHYS